MRTPRPANRPRNVSTLIGNGWLHESPRNLWPREWDIRSRSQMRKCMFLPMPPHAMAAMQRQAIADGHVSPAAMPMMPPAHAQGSAPMAVRKADPKRRAQLLPAVSSDEVYAKLQNDAQARLLAKPASPAAPGAWFEDPVALGTLLILFPPIGLAALWSSKRYSNDARWALTVMTALTLCLGACVIVAVIAMRQ